MILYHGASDPSIPASQSIAFYRELADQRQGVERTQESVRLFLVPGMHHCSGGPAPDRFDRLSAIEASTRPDSKVQHRLPLCPYTAQARYRGAGEISDASNWSCAAGNAD
jgi:feruloyl esterase